jgi:transcription antitermination factor NusG
VVVEKPVFSGYFFVAFDRDSRATLLRTNNVVRIIRPEDQQRLLHELDQIQLALEVDPTLATCMALKRGRLVRIRGGAFMGIEGVVSSLKNGSPKVRLNVDLIGRAVAMEIDRDLLELID